MTVTEPVAAPPRPAEPTPSAGSPVAVRFLAALVTVIVAIAVVWALLFFAFGTTDGTVSQARRVTDAFARPDGAGLGTPTRGPKWDVTAGTWVTNGGQAEVERPASDGRSVAISPLRATQVRLAATATKVAPGWGLAFRYQSQRAFWFVAVVDDAGTLRIGRVKGSKVIDTQDITTAKVTDGSKVEVRVDGRSVEVWIDGQIASEVTTDELWKATGIGLLLAGSHTEARWDDVAGGPLPAPAIVIPPATP